MSNFSALEIGKRALLAQRLGLDVTSNNIANVNTPGYARRTAILNESSPIKNGNNLIGNGVQVDKIKSYRDEYFDKEIRTTSSRLGGYSTDIDVFQKIEAVLVEPTDNGLSELTTNFFKAFEELGQQPESVGYRNNLLSTAKTLTERFNYTANHIADVREEVRVTLNNSVTNANQLLKDIADLNKNISNSKVSSSGEAQTYVDQRNLKIEELSKEFNVNVSFANNGSANVFLNGINLVTGSDASEVRLNESVNSVTGERTLSLEKFDKENNTKTSLDPQAGNIASFIKHYNVTLDDKDSSGGFSAATGLHTFAKAIVQNVNQLSVTGYGLDDKGPNPPGRTFFEPAVGDINAFNMTISKDILDKPRNIPLSSAPNEAGNAQISNAIGRLAYSDSFLDKQTPIDYFSAYLGKIGNLSKEANNGQTTTKMISNQLESQRESVIGVNLDEEAVNLIKFQKAFEASSRIVNTTNELLATIVNLGR